MILLILYSRHAYHYGFSAASTKITQKYTTTAIHKNTDFSYFSLKYFSTMQYSISSNMGHMNVQEWMQKTRRKIQHLLHKNTIQNCGKNPVLLQKKWKGYNVVFWCRPTYHIDFFSFVWGRQATEPFCVCAVVIDHITCRLTFEHWNFHCIHAYQCFDR